MGDKLTVQTRAEVEVWGQTVDLWWTKIHSLIKAEQWDEAYVLMSELRVAQDSLRGLLAGLTYVPNEIEVR